MLPCLLWSIYCHLTRPIERDKNVTSIPVVRRHTTDKTLEDEDIWEYLLLVVSDEEMSLCKLKLDAIVAGV